MNLNYFRQHSGLVVSGVDSRSVGLDSSLGGSYCNMFLGKTLKLSQFLSTLQLKNRQLLISQQLILEVLLKLPSILSRGREMQNNVEYFQALHATETRAMHWTDGLHVLGPNTENCIPISSVQFAMTGLWFWRVQDGPSSW